MLFGGSCHGAEAMHQLGYGVNTELSVDGFAVVMNRAGADL